MEANDFFYNCNNLSTKIGKKNDNEGIKWAKGFIKTIHYSFDDNKNENDNDKNDKHSKNTIELKSNKIGMDTKKVGENSKFENNESVFSSEDKK